jgi:hypothetical protein
VTLRKILAAATLTTGFAVAPGFAVDPAEPAAPAYQFSALKTMAPDVAKAKCEAWLKAQGKFDQSKFDAAWADGKRPLVDRVADSIALGNPDAAAVVVAARNPNSPVPAAVPAVLKDAKLDPFVRSNLALVFARSAANKKAYEEALEALTLDGVAPEQVVDPASYFFFKAVAAHSLAQYEPTKKAIAVAAINRLRNDIADVPDRYRMVAILMFFEMDKWPDNPLDLSNIERLMDNSGRRLDLARPDPETQKIQRKIVFRLDELIKEKENQAGGGGGQANKGECPGGGQPGSGPGSQPGNGNQPGQPLQDTKLVQGASGTNKDINKELQLATQNWGSLTPDERKKVIDQITRDYPPKYKPMIDEYFKSLNRIHGLSNK